VIPSKSLFASCKKFLTITVFMTLGLFITSTPSSYAADICKEGLRDLNKSQGVIQSKGGIWGYIEKSSNLKDHSILGFQIDGKLQRLVSTFETLCEDGKTPTPKLHQLISSLLGDARVVFNKNADRQKKEEIVGQLNNLNKEIDALLAQLPQ